MDLDVGDHLKQFAYEDLQLLTDDFDERNFVGRSQFCKVYRGKIPQGWKGMQEQDVTVKIWTKMVKMFTEYAYYNYGENVTRFYDEITFLTLPTVTGHPNLPKLMGFFYEVDKPVIQGVVYDLKSSGTIRSFIVEGTFKWMDRIKAIFGLARLLEFLHGQSPPILVRNISGDHIMIDQDCNPVLFEFSFPTGEVFGKNGQCEPLYRFGPHGYIDPRIMMTGIWMEGTDVYGFGVILLELLCKGGVGRLEDRNINDNPYFIHQKAEDLYSLANNKGSGFGRSKIFYIIHLSFAGEAGFDADDGLELIKLGMKCVDVYGKDGRPTMREVVKQLRRLRVIRNYAELILMGP